MEFEKGFDSRFKITITQSFDVGDKITYKTIRRENLISFFDAIFKEKVGSDTDICSYSLYFDTSYDPYESNDISVTMYIEKMETEQERLVRYEKWLKNKEKRAAKQQKIS